MVEKIYIYFKNQNKTLEMLNIARGKKCAESPIIICGKKRTGQHYSTQASVISVPASVLTVNSPTHHRHKVAM